MKSTTDQIQDMRTRKVTRALVASMSLLAVAAYFLAEAPVAASLFAFLAICCAFLLLVLPARWNKLVIDVLANFGW